MHSIARTVDAYLDGVPSERRAALEHLRSLCRDILSGYEETMTFRMPTYTREGVAEIAFASQKNYISFYVLKKDVVDAHRHELADAGKGCIRYAKPEKIDYAVIESLLRGTVASSVGAC